jgi:hypothetical protein
MEIENYKPIGKGCLVAKFDIKIPEWGGLSIHDCGLFKKENRRWITLPTREYQGKDGVKKHFHLIKFNPQVLEKLQAAALVQLDKFVAAPLPEAVEMPCDPVPF